MNEHTKVTILKITQMKKYPLSKGKNDWSKWTNEIKPPKSLLGDPVDTEYLKLCPTKPIGF